ncbi:Jag N-terminal domain-containing protein [Nitrosophilus alvini]|uniref:Jag N-terminal domain-containing protein n=1 Tax=Nitrosophilus alvini TaxID=2714855 RepID=UPI0019092D3B|nr:Jag N-terminal domain-containing protein [Nitrosophilus alvini]
MTKKIEAPTLKEAYSKAAQELGCSIMELEVEIIQNPSKGFLGFGKKNAIILAKCKTEKKEEQKSEESPVLKKEEIKAKTAEEIRKSEQKPKTEKRVAEVKRAAEKIQKPAKSLKAEGEKPLIEKKEIKRQPPVIKNDMFEDFYKETKTINDIAQEIEDDINSLFKQACFEIDKITVTPYDEKTVLIEFNGKDAALLIGKEGYRYKALSYILFNWINSKYDLQIRLEIAEFLKTQEEMIRNYLKPLIENIKKEGKGQTKPLDGVLVQIALRELRSEFPEKYVAIRTNRNGDKFILVSEFNKKNGQQ